MKSLHPHSFSINLKLVSMLKMPEPEKDHECSDSSATPSFPSQPEGKIGLPRANPRGRLTFHFHALEKEMATHSSVLAWRIPGTGEPGAMGSQRVGQDRVTELN